MDHKQRKQPAARPWFVCGITVTAILFSLFVPETEACFCADCSCPRNISKQSSLPVERRSCCSKQPVRKSCCRSAAAETGCRNKATAKTGAAQGDSTNRCRCGCSGKTIAPALSVALQRSRSGEETERSVSFKQRIGNSTAIPTAFVTLLPARVAHLSLLPVRLHLFLLVLRN